MGALDRNIGAYLFKQPAGHKNAAASIALGQGVGQIEPNLSVRLMVGNSKVGGEQKGRLLQAKACRHEKIGKQRIANAVAIAGAGSRSALGEMPPQTDIPEYPIVLKGDEANIRSARSGLVGLIARRNLRTTTTMSLPPNGTVTEGRFGDQTFPSAPSIEAVQAGDGAIPGRGRDALPSFSPAANSMIGKNIVSVSLPYRLAAGFRKKTDPDQDVITIGTERVAGADAVEG